jgi:hypothetical protein
MSRHDSVSYKSRVGSHIATVESRVISHESRSRKETVRVTSCFRDTAWEKGDELIICKTNFTQEWAIEANKGKCTQTTGDPEIPPEYQWHTTVFLEEAAKRFPLARPEDHTIKLKPDAPTTINCKVYPLSHQELEVMAKFL